MQNDKRPVENQEVCELVINLVGKPKNFHQCRAINVYDDRYRVNIYATRQVEGIEGKCISSSYFVKYNKDDGVKILNF